MAGSLATLQRDIAELRERLRPPAEPMPPNEVAHLVGFAALDSWQADIISATGSALVCCGRQTGKSTAVALRAVVQAVSQPATTTIITAPTLRQSQLLYAKVRAFLSALGAAVPAMVEESALRFRLTNSAEVLAVPGDGRGFRGYTAHLCIADEAPLVHDDTFAALFPMTATTGGPILLLGTPHGRRGLFFQLWDSADPAWTRTMIRSTESPRISPTWLADQRRNLPSHQFRQEFLCEFVQTDDAFFSADSIARAFVAGTPLFPVGTEDTADVA